MSAETEISAKIERIKTANAAADCLAPEFVPRVQALKRRAIELFGERATEVLLEVAAAAKADTRALAEDLFQARVYAEFGGHSSPEEQRMLGKQGL